MTDEEKFAQFVRRYIRAVRNYISENRTCFIDADYLALEVFIRIWRSGFDVASLPSPDDAWRFLRRVARSVIVDYVRRSKREQAFLLLMERLEEL